MSRAFYHYTSTEGKDAILKEAIIRESGDTGDAVFGRGVYGTSMDPKTFSEAGGVRSFWERKLVGGRVDYVFKVVLPTQLVEQVKYEELDMLMYQGDLDLSDYSWEVLKVD